MSAHLQSHSLAHSHALAHAHAHSHALAHSRCPSIFNVNLEANRVEQIKRTLKSAGLDKRLATKINDVYITGTLGIAPGLDYVIDINVSNIVIFRFAGVSSVTAGAFKSKNYRSHKQKVDKKIITIDIDSWNDVPIEDIAQIVPGHNKRISATIHEYMGKISFDTSRLIVDFLNHEIIFAMINNYDSDKDVNILFINKVEDDDIDYDYIILKQKLPSVHIFMPISKEYLQKYVLVHTLENDFLRENNLIAHDDEIETTYVPTYVPAHVVNPEIPTYKPSSLRKSRSVSSINSLTTTTKVAAMPLIAFASGIDFVNQSHNSDTNDEFNSVTNQIKIDDAKAKEQAKENAKAQAKANVKAKALAQAKTQAKMQARVQSQAKATTNTEISTIANIGDFNDNIFARRKVPSKKSFVLEELLSKLGLLYKNVDNVMRVLFRSEHSGKIIWPLSMIGTLIYYLNKGGTSNKYTERIAKVINCIIIVSNLDTLFFKKITPENKNGLVITKLFIMIDMLRKIFSFLKDNFLKRTECQMIEDEVLTDVLDCTLESFEAE